MLPILKFAPIMKSTVWGGRKLSSFLGKNLPDEAPYGESWELVDLPSDVSTVMGTGETLDSLRESKLDELLGAAPLLEGRFPLLIKYIDARATLSVQVHPDEAACRRIGGGARPKTEAWYVIDREPGAALFVGLEEGVTRESFAAAIRDGDVARLLRRVPVEPGDLIYLPAGTIHAIGEGVFLAEVQQSSATTYRVFDWNRMGLDGKPRDLHVEQALESIDYSQVGPPSPTPTESGRDGLVCPFFSMEIVDSANEEIVFGGASIFMGVGGDGTSVLEAGGSRVDIGLGETVLVPACAGGRVRVSSSGESRLLAVGILG